LFTGIHDTNVPGAENGFTGKMAYVFTPVSEYSKSLRDKFQFHMKATPDTITNICPCSLNNVLTITRLQHKMGAEDDYKWIIDDVEVKAMVEVRFLGSHCGS
jgi:hypothetical protein